MSAAGRPAEVADAADDVGATDEVGSTDESPIPNDLLVEIEQLIGLLTAHPDAEVGANTTALLDRVDAVHRTALTHLMGAIQSMAGDAFVNRLTGDPAIRLLLMSYDLLAVDRRTLTEEALDAVRGHLHAHGIDVELEAVLGGVVSVRLHGAPPTSDAAYAGVVGDIEEALRHGLIGFQELELSSGKAARAAAPDSIFLPREALQRAHRPVYRELCKADALPNGTLRSAMVDNVNVLVAHVDGEYFAVRNACGESPLPLDYSTLSGTELCCSWHGCRYDIRSGHRLDRPDAARAELLSVLPVRVRDGVVEVVVGTAAAHTSVARA
ncbi:MAG: Rieske 2Fe-2S domain-containing protein [Gemmatimonadaceae bacterium]|nr:Rieske 2Fe-2S domain-containing protein [Gemmatimonadaceae bacterium]